MTNLESLLAGLCCSFFILSAYIIIDGAQNYRPPTVRLPTNASPIIPDCELPAWERIRGECDE